MKKTKEKILRYKEDQKKRLASFVAGKRDLNGNDIIYIYIKSDNFVIYEIKTANPTESLKVVIDTEDEADPEQIVKRFDTIRSAFTEFKGVIYKIQNYSSHKTIAAHLISQALNGDPDDANIKFREVIKDINRQYAEQFKYRLFYLITALIFVLFNIVASTFVYLTHILDSSIQLRNLIFVVTGGSIGGFISLSRKLKEMIFEKDVKSYMFIFYSLERIFISMFAAIVSYMAIKSNLVFGIVQTLRSDVFAYILFAVAAGFSETLIPNLLIRFEEKKK